MKQLKEASAEQFAQEKFKQLSHIEQIWNQLHSKYIIEALGELGAFGQFNKNKLSALAYVHDIGKIEGEDKHPEKGLKILEKNFKLDNIDIDCILNHGSNSRPQTPAGKIFRNADGISLFYPEIVHFIFYAEALEGKSLEQIKEGIKERYEKYAKAYAQDKIAIVLLQSKYESLQLY